MAASSKSRSLRTILVVGAALFVAGCELLGETALPDYGEVTEISYARHVDVLFEERCTVCHDGNGPLPDLTSFEGLLAGSSSGGVVVPFAPDRSPLIRLLQTRPAAAHPTEYDMPRLPEVEIEFLRRWIAEGATDDSGTVPYADAQNRLIATLPATASLAVIDAERQAVARLIDLVDLGFSAASRPTAVTASRDGSSWFVSLPGEGLVLQFNRANNLVGLAEIEDVGSVASSSDGRWIVTGRVAGVSTGQIETTPTSTMVPVPAQVAFNNLHAVAIRPQGDVVYAASQQADQLIVLPAGQTSPSFTAINGPRHAVTTLLTSPDGSSLYALGGESGEVVVYHLSSPTAPAQQGAIGFGAGLVAGDVNEQTLAVRTTAGEVWVSEAVAAGAPRMLDAVSGALPIALLGQVVAVPSASRPGRFEDVATESSLVLIDVRTGVRLREIVLDDAVGGITALASATQPTSVPR